METIQMIHEALEVLYSPDVDPISRREADTWLQSWRSRKDSWQLCASTLNAFSAQLSDAACYFLACTLHIALQRTADVIHPNSDLHFQAIHNVSAALLNWVSQGRGRNVASEMAASLAALAIRSQDPAWQPNDILPRLIMTLQQQAKKAEVVHSSTPEQNTEWQQQQQQQHDHNLLLAVLHTIKACSTEICSKGLSCHPLRRSVVIQALKGSEVAAQWSGLGLGQQEQHGLCPSETAMAIQLITADMLKEWAYNFGIAPLGLSAHQAVIDTLCSGCFQSDICSCMSDCVCELLGVYASRQGKAGKASSSTSKSAGPEVSSAQVDYHLFHMLVSSWNAAALQGSQIPQPQLQIHVSSEVITNIQSQNILASSSHAVELACCHVLRAAAAALLHCSLESMQSTALGAANVEHSQDYLAEFFKQVDQLMIHLIHVDDELALIAADFFSGTYLPALKTLQVSGNLTHSLIIQHTPLLQRLTESLVLRTQLKPEVSTVATADARDLPEDARMVRRELASILRDLSSLIGHDTLLSFLALLTSNSQNSQSWLRLECLLYAANVVIQKWSADTFKTEASVSHDDDDDDEGPDDQGMDKDSSQTTRSQNSFSEGADTALLGLVSVSVFCCNTQLIWGSCKLIGTALTLLGGLGPWLHDRLLHQSMEGFPLPLILDAVFHTLQSDDEKLSRNGATTFQRLCTYEGLASHILKFHSSWVDSVVQLYQMRGGLLQRSGPHQDASTEELMLITLCRLSCLSEGNPHILKQLAEPQLNEIVFYSSVISNPNHLQVVDTQHSQLHAQCCSSIGVLATIMDASTDKELLQSLDKVEQVKLVGLGPAQRLLVDVLTSIVVVLHDNIGSLFSHQPPDKPPDRLLLIATCTFFTAATNSLALSRRSEQVILPLLRALSWLLGQMATLHAEVSGMMEPVQLISVTMKTLLAYQNHCLLTRGMNSSADHGLPMHTEHTCHHNYDAVIFEQQLEILAAQLETFTSTVVASGFALLGHPTEHGSVDSNKAISILCLFNACVEFLPSCLVLPPFSPEILLAAMQAACCTSDIDQCHAALSCCSNLALLPIMAAGRTFTAFSPWHLRQHEASKRLSAWLEGGGGAALLQVLLLATAGSMPSSMILPLSSTLHRIWLDLGSGRFAHWMESAMLRESPSTGGGGSERAPPWFCLKPEQRQAFLNDLLSTECVRDVPRFKRLIKTLCGGKRKGEN